VCHWHPGNRQEYSYVASRNTHVEATPVFIQESREREPIKTKRAGRKLVPPYIFLPGERQSGRSSYSLAPRRKKAERTKVETTLVRGSNVRSVFRGRQVCGRWVKERKILREGVCEATTIQIEKFSAKGSLQLRRCRYKRWNCNRWVGNLSRYEQCRTVSTEQCRTVRTELAVRVCQRSICGANGSNVYWHGSEPW
jgi:hypothetical protein